MAMGIRAKPFLLDIFECCIGNFKICLSSFLNIISEHHFQAYVFITTPFVELKHRSKSIRSYFVLTYSDIGVVFIPLGKAAKLDFNTTQVLL